MGEGEMGEYRENKYVWVCGSGRGERACRMDMKEVDILPPTDLRAIHAYYLMP